jgi:hypothetical protein
VQSTFQPLAIESSVRYLSSSASWIIGFLITVFSFFPGMLFLVSVKVDFQILPVAALLLHLLQPVFFGKCIAFLLLQDLGTLGERVKARPDCPPVDNKERRADLRPCSVLRQLLKLFSVDSPVNAFRPTLVPDTEVCVVRKVFFKASSVQQPGQMDAEPLSACSQFLSNVF